jgi:hypothetical protein
MNANDTAREVAAISQCLVIVGEAANTLRIGGFHQARGVRLAGIIEHLEDALREILEIPVPKRPLRNTIRAKRTA